MSAAIRRLQDHPLITAEGWPLGDGSGMPELVAQIEPLFRYEASLIRWVAIRGALLYLDMLCPDDTAMEQLLPRMGLSTECGPDGATVRVVDPTGRLDDSAAGQVTGLFHSLVHRWQNYAQLAEMAIPDVNRSPQWAVVGPSMGLDYIVWVAAAMVRSGAWAGGGMRDVPPPDRLDKPGWYVEPVFAKSERYWDGTDWTERIRARVDGRQHEISLALK